MSINKLDKLDWKILASLDKNARASYSSIAKEVKLSKQAVKNRLDNLISEQIITQFITFVNMGYLGITPYKVFIKFQTIQKEKKQEIISYLLQRPTIGVVTVFEGIYDLYFGVMTRHPHELDHELKLFYNKFANYISERKTVALIDTQVLPRNYLIEQKRPSSVNSITFHSSKISSGHLKQLEQQILMILNDDALIPATKIATITHNSVQTIINRIKHLEKEKVITGYGYLLNETMFVSYLMLVQLNTLSEEVQQKMIHYLQTLPNVILIIKTIGDWDYEIGVEAKELTECRRCMEEFREQFSPYLKSSTPLLVHRMLNIKNYIN